MLVHHPVFRAWRLPSWLGAREVHQRLLRRPVGRRPPGALLQGWALYSSHRRRQVAGGFGNHHVQEWKGSMVYGRAGHAPQQMTTLGHVKPWRGIRSLVFELAPLAWMPLPKQRGENQSGICACMSKESAECKGKPLTCVKLWIQIRNFTRPKGTFVPWLFEQCVGCVVLELGLIRLKPLSKFVDGMYMEAFCNKDWCVRLPLSPQVAHRVLIQPFSVRGGIARHQSQRLPKLGRESTPSTYTKCCCHPWSGDG